MASNQPTEADLNLQMQASLQWTREQADQVRPENTSKAYKYKQQEFKDWCTEKGFPEVNHYVVNEEKLHLFLEEWVVI